MVGIEAVVFIICMFFDFANLARKRLFTLPDWVFGGFDRLNRKPYQVPKVARLAIETPEPIWMLFWMYHYVYPRIRHAKFVFFFAHLCASLVFSAIAAVCDFWHLPLTLAFACNIAHCATANACDMFTCEPESVHGL